MQSRLSPRMRCFCLLAGIFAFSASAGATVVTWQTPVGATTSGPVDITATFTTSTNTVSITIQNLQANPADVTQNVSGFEFTLSTTPTGSSSLTSSSAQQRTVNGNGTYSTGAFVATQWGFSSASDKLDVLGTPEAPAHTIIGPPGTADVYSSANGSIAGSHSHNPFLAGPVTFTLNVPGVSSTTTVTGATFYFGTTEGKYSVISVVPEPASAAVLGIGSLALLVRRRRGASAFSK